jgi:hypothetical protein
MVRSKINLAHLPMHGEKRVSATLQGLTDGHYLWMIRAKFVPAPLNKPALNGALTRRSAVFVAQAFGPAHLAAHPSAARAWDPPLRTMADAGKPLEERSRARC